MECFPTTIIVVMIIISLPSVAENDPTRYFVIAKVSCVLVILSCAVKNFPHIFMILL